jgi:AraC family transcriptional activator of pobA
MSASAIPRFSLYGETPQQAEARFLHLEALEERSRPSDWTIRPHVHPDLHQVFWVTAGAGDISLDAGLSQLAAPFLVIAPAGVVHAFTWPPGTQGHVLTLADSYLRETTGRFPELAEMFAQGLAVSIALDDAPAVALKSALDGLGRELVWDAPCHEAAVEAHLLAVLVALRRMLAQAVDAEAQRLGPAARVVSRFRDLVEGRFRSDAAISDYAEALGLTEKQLRTACLKVTGMSPLQQLRRRRALEAKRLLTYSSMTVTEIAYSLGFEDPAYFSRFFSEEAGQSPRAFRADRSRVEPG